jgi:acyl-CoA synthetase (AMP-forming)/AMP-acid ligase II
VTGPLQNVVQHLADLAVDHGDRLALIEPGGRSMTFEQLDLETAAIAGGLHEAGATPGDRFLLLAPMGIPLYLGLLGLLRAGCTGALVDISAPTARLRENLARLELKGFIGSGKAQLLRLRYPELRGLDIYVNTGGFCPLPARTLERIRGAPVGPIPVNCPALITFTSGTTGRPRAIARSHDFLEAQHAILASHMHMGPHDVDLPTLPVFLLNSLGAGATCVFPDADLRRVDAVDPAVIAGQLRAHRVTSTSGSPAFFGPVARWLDERGETIPTLQKLFVGGGRVPTGLLERLLKVFPEAQVEVVYGSTEAEPITTIDAEEVVGLGGDAAGRGSCVGRPVPGTQVRLWKPGVVEGVRPGEVGEVVVAGRHVNPRYWKDEKATLFYKVPLESLVWHRTGDLARFDSQGRLWLVGRVGEGVNGVYPLEVEGLLEGLGWVARAGLVEVGGQAVLGVEVMDPPEQWEERLKAAARVDRVVEVKAVPVDARHNAKVDRVALKALLT